MAAKSIKPMTREEICRWSEKNYRRLINMPFSLRFEEFQKELIARAERPEEEPEAKNQLKLF